MDILLLPIKIIIVYKNFKQYHLKVYRQALALHALGNSSINLTTKEVGIVCIGLAKSADRGLKIDRGLVSAELAVGGGRVQKDFVNPKKKPLALCQNFKHTSQFQTF